MWPFRNLTNTPQYDPPPKPNLPEREIIIDNLLNHNLTNDNALTLACRLIRYYVNTPLPPTDALHLKIAILTAKLTRDIDKTRQEISRKSPERVFLESSAVRSVTWPELVLELSDKTMRDPSNVDWYFVLRGSVARAKGVMEIFETRYLALVGIEGIHETQIGVMVLEMMKARSRLGNAIHRMVSLNLVVREIVVRDLKMGNYGRIL